MRSQAGKVAPLLSMVKILQICNYPPPRCGRVIQIVVTEELRPRGLYGGSTHRGWPVTVKSRIVDAG